MGVFLLLGLILAVAVMVFVPRLTVDEQDYRCSPASTATSTAPIPSSCRGAAGADGIDDQALDAARAAARSPLGVVSGALLAGSAALIGIIVSNHTAALTRDALNATKERDDGTAERERERADDERYATAIEQLGHASASVRLGGMHSLHRLALSDPGRLPTVIDVLCAYLRQPFHHPHHDRRTQSHPFKTGRSAQAWRPAGQEERDERDGEREVRATATRLIPTLLPATPPPQGVDAPAPLEINLRGAMLDGLDLSGRRTGQLRLDGTYIAGDLALGHNTHITGNLALGDNTHVTGNLALGASARITGDLWLGTDTRIAGGLWLGAKAHVGSLQLGAGARIGASLGLGAGAHIDRGLALIAGACINGSLQLGAAAYIDGFLRLSKGAHIGDGVQLEAGAHIDGFVRLAAAAHIGGLTLGDAAFISGTLTLIEHAYIDGTLTLDEHAHINGGFHLIKGAYVTGSVVLRQGARIKGPVVIGEGARIDGHLVGAKGSLSVVRRHPKAGMRGSWFASADVPVVELGD